MLLPQGCDEIDYGYLQHGRAELQGTKGGCCTSLLSGMGYHLWVWNKYLKLPTHLIAYLTEMFVGWVFFPRKFPKLLDLNSG